MKKLFFTIIPFACLIVCICIAAFSVVLSHQIESKMNSSEANETVWAMVFATPPDDCPPFEILEDISITYIMPADVQHGHRIKEPEIKSMVHPVREAGFEVSMNDIPSIWNWSRVPEPPATIWNLTHTQYFTYGRFNTTGSFDYNNMTATFDWSCIGTVWVQNRTPYLRPGGQTAYDVMVMIRLGWLDYYRAATEAYAKQYPLTECYFKKCSNGTIVEPHHCKIVGT